MKLDPQVAAWLAERAQEPMPHFQSMTVADIRAFDQASPCPAPVEAPLARVHEGDFVFQKTRSPYRIYIPEGSVPLPALLYLHGGGFIFGGIEKVDSRCRLLAAHSKAVVINFAYPLAPEYPFPQAINAGLAFSDWLFQQASVFNIDSARLAVGGESAGATLATTLALIRTELKRPGFSSQCLIYPATDTDFTRPSHQQFSDGFGMPKEMMQWFLTQYFQKPSDREHPYAVPMNFRDKTGLPPTLLVTAGHDPLRDEGKHYAEALHDAGVPVHYHCYDELVHGFCGLYDFVPAAKNAYHDIIDWVTRQSLMGNASEMQPLAAYCITGNQ